MRWSPGLSDRPSNVSRLQFSGSTGGSALELGTLASEVEEEGWRTLEIPPNEPATKK